MKPGAGKGGSQPQDNKNDDQSFEPNQSQLLQHLTNMTGGSATENNNVSGNSQALQQNQSLNSTQNFQAGLQNALLSGNQFFMTNPNFETEGASGNLSQSRQGGKKGSALAEEGGEGDQIQQNSVLQAAQQLQLAQQQQLLQTQQQLQYLTSLQQLQQVAGQSVGNQHLG